MAKSKRKDKREKVVLPFSTAVWIFRYRLLSSIIKRRCNEQG